VRAYGKNHKNPAPHKGVGFFVLQLTTYVMIKNLQELQKNSQHADFAKRMTSALRKKNIDPSPAVVTSAFNQQSKVTTLKPHTVRKWLLGISQPRTETLLLLAEWLNLEPQDLLTDKQAPQELKNKFSFEFDFTDQEVISKYLAMTVKEKITVRLVIDAISEKHR
jgi:transcriptional regulator with XRE-family HTH domain